MTDPAFADEELDLRWVDGETWIVRKPYVYRAPDGTVVVPVGTPTDFASIPRPLWPALPPTGPYGPAAVLHDFMFRTGRWSPDGPRCSMRDANRVLHLAMVDLRCVPKWQRMAVDAGVFVGGWVQWRKYRNRDGAQPVENSASTETAKRQSVEI